MFSGLTLIIVIFAILFPFVALLKFVVPANKMFMMGKEKNIDIFSLFNNLLVKDLFTIKDFVYENFDMFEDNDKNEIYSLCLKVRNGFFLHLATGFLYLFLLIILVINILYGIMFKNTIPIIEQFLWIFSLSLPFSLFYLIPFFRLIGKFEWASFLENLITKLLRFPDVIVWKWFIYALRFILLFIYMYLIIFFQSSFDNLIPHIPNVRFEILYYIICLCIYHYGINYLFGSLFNQFDKKIYPDISIKYSRKLQKNNNYLFMLIMYFIAVIFKNETSGIFISITLIFLFDTFIHDKQKIIKEYYRSLSKK